MSESRLSNKTTVLIQENTHTHQYLCFYTDNNEVIYSSQFLSPFLNHRFEVLCNQIQYKNNNG